MNIVKKLELLEHLTTSEQCVQQFILNNPQLFLDSKPSDIADMSHVSLPTLYRLVNKLKLNGVQELKLEIASSLNQETHSDIDINFPISSEDSVYQSMCHLKEVYSKTIEDTLDLADPDKIIEIAKLLNQASCIDIYTTSANVYFAKNFQFQMQEINKLVQVPTEEYTTQLMAANSDESHVAIIVSFGGRGRITRMILPILKENHVRTILITSNQNKHLIPEVDYVVYMSSIEDHFHKMSSFATRLTLLYIFDTLYATVFKLNYEGNAKLKYESYKKMNPSLK